MASMSQMGVVISEIQLNKLKVAKKSEKLESGITFVYVSGCCSTSLFWKIKKVGFKLMKYFFSVNRENNV